MSGIALSASSSDRDEGAGSGLVRVGGRGGLLGGSLGDLGLGGGGLGNLGLDRGGLSGRGLSGGSLGSRSGLGSVATEELALPLGEGLVSGDDVLVGAATGASPSLSPTSPSRTSVTRRSRSVSRASGVTCPPLASVTVLPRSSVRAIVSVSMS